MKVSFSVSDLNELFAEVSQQTDSAIITEKYEQVLKFPSLIADGWMRTRFKISREFYFGSRI